MKKFYTLLVSALVGYVGSAQIVNVPDANFKAKLLAASTGNSIAMDLSYNYFRIDSNYDGEIQVSEAQQVSLINVSGSTISDLTGISSFPNLYLLNCSSNQLTTLDVSNN